MSESGSVLGTTGGRLALSKVVPHWLFPALLVPCCLFILLLTAVTPPLEVPDEMQHFYRAYQIGDGAAPGRVQGGAAGADLPIALAEMTQHFLGTKEIHAARPLRPQPWSDTIGYRNVPLQPEQREFTSFGSQIIYSPLGYLPQASGIWLGRLVGSGPLGLLYAARLANALVALTIIIFAIRLLPSGRAAIAATAFLPMAAYEIASASADGQVIAFAILYTAIAVKGLRAGQWTLPDIVAALAAGLIVTTVKLPYLPLVLIGLPALLTSPRRTSTIAFAIGIPAVCGLASLAWLHHVAPLVLVTQPDLPATNAAEQLAYLHEHPVAIIRVALNTLLHSKFLLTSMIGNLGWLTVPLPSLGILIGLGSLLCAAICRPSPSFMSPLLNTAWALLLFAASVALTGVALYLTWTPVGFPNVQGLQGRYLLPMLPILLFCASMVMGVNDPGGRARQVECCCLILALANAALTIAVLIVRFKVLG